MDLKHRHSSASAQRPSTSRSPRVACRLQRQTRKLRRRRSSTPTKRRQPSGPQIPTDEEINYEDADLVEGGELFRTNCSQCHNFTGAGGALSNGAYAPDLRDATPRQIYEAMLTGPENMPVFSNETLTPENKQAIIKYIQNMDEQASYGGWAIGSLGPVNEGAFIWIIGIGLLIGAAVWIGARVR